jgi:uncharacterized protein
VRFRISDFLRISHRGRDHLFIVSNAAIVEVDREAAEAIEDLAREAAGAGLEMERARKAFATALGDDGLEILEDLEALGLLEPAVPGGDGFTAANPVLGQDPARPLPVGSITIDVAQDCNLRCSYCYAGHGLYGGAAPRLLPPDAARRYVDFLFRESGNLSPVRLTFFGGEPLLNFPAIEAAVERGRALESSSGRRIRFSLTTNGTLLDDAKLRFILDAGIAVTASVDGPPDVHDSGRRHPDGRGSYAEAMEHLRPLLIARPTPARATLTRRCLDVGAIVDHLVEQGFAEAGVTPAVTGDPDLRLEALDWEVLGDSLVSTADRWEARVLAGGVPRFTNVTNLVLQFRDGSSRGYPCGAGAGLLAGDAAGRLFACHRLVGDRRFALGDVEGGIDREAQAALLRRLHARERPRCGGCWARPLCSGGCYHLAAAGAGHPTGPASGGSGEIPREMCDLIRRWYERCLRVYLTLAEERPEVLAPSGGDPGARRGLDGSARDPHSSPLMD